MLRYHLYVSASRLDRAGSGAELERLVARARERNLERGITGALVFSGTRFAQYLEGPELMLNSLLQEICRDPRHHQFTSLDEGPCSERRCKEWNLAYSGPSLYVDRHIKALVSTVENDPARRRGIDQLMQLILSATESIYAGRRLPPRNTTVSL